MKTIKNLLTVSAFSLLVLGLPAIASAQWGGNNRGGYGGYGGYGNVSYNRNLRATVENLKNRARNFERITNRIEDRDDDRYGDGRYGNGRYGNYGGYGNGDIGRIEDLADAFRRATDRLENEFGNGRNMNNSRDEAQRVLDIGRQIDNEIYRSRSNRRLQNDWNQIRYDLDVLAQAYGYGGYNNRTNRNRNGNWRNNIPFPLPF
jgi:hypothetical protein